MIDIRAVCVTCWGERYPGKGVPLGRHDGSGTVDAEGCGYCGKLTTAGIFIPMAGDPQSVACPLCGKPARKYSMASPEGTVTVIGCNCVPKERAAVMVPERLDRRLTGACIPRYADLNSPLVLARLQRLVQAFRQRNAQPGQGLADARQMAGKLDQLREEGFTDEDRAELLAWAERVARGE